jgi:hypothetical protein
MKKQLLFIFILIAGIARSQCSLTASVTIPSCSISCNAIVTFSLSGGCTAFPYVLTVSGNSSCTAIPTITMTSAVATVSNICECSSPYSAVLTNTMSFPVAFTNFAVFAGPPPTNVLLSNAPASCSACCNGSLSAFVAGGTSPYTYTWTGPATSANTSSITNLCPGIYTLCSTDSKGCTDCDTYTVGVATSINENQMREETLYCLADEYVFINTASVSSMSVYDLTGRLVLRIEELNSKEVHLPKNKFQKGIYVVHLEGTDHLRKHKIVIE